MKKTILFFCLMALTLFAQAAYLKNVPVTLIQPNGDTLRCFATGDEFYHRLHDANGYTILQNHSTGYYVYGMMQNGELVASSYIVGSTDPSTLGLKPNLSISRREWSERQKAFDVPQEFSRHQHSKTSGTNNGTINNVVVFIRFAGDSPITTTLSDINSKFNDSSANSTSMYQYFKAASYNKLHIFTHYYPAPSNNSIVSYQDTFARSFYMPYDATTNPNGYADDNDRRSREFGLLERAVNYVNANSPVPNSLNIDYDHDGYVDNICFVVKGTYTGWSDLLWPHKWSLYDRQVMINGKRVYTFNLQLEGSGEHYFSSSTFCHEMFHTLGAPDLYRYDVGDDVSGVGSWDLMCSNTTPPQHMSAYMKYKYGNWLDSIPEITIPGTYTLYSLADSNLNENPIKAYKIASQDPNQWYVLEYRDNSEYFETGLPGKGLLIFRIDTRYEGNAGYDGVSNFDEVYLFRPGASNDFTNGNTSQACFSSQVGRTSFTPNTNPYPWLTQNIVDTTINITAISYAGNTISFTYSNNTGCTIPNALVATNPTNATIQLSWHGHATQYRIHYRQADNPSVEGILSTNGSSCTLYGLQPNTTYEWNVTSLCSATDSSLASEWNTFHTISCAVPTTATIGSNDTSLYYYPINTYYNYSHSQQIISAAEIGSAGNLLAVRFNYNYTSAATSKTNCTIYVAHTTLSSYTSYNQAVACSTMTKVYEGPMACTQGWNEFTFDAPFAYNGTDNLLIAVEDNSGAYNTSNFTFACERTDGYQSLVFYSDSENPDPNNLGTSYSGTKRMQKFRNEIQFLSCVPNSDVMITALSNNDSYGTVSGGGIVAPSTIDTLTALANHGYHFVQWSDGNTDNPRIITVTSDTVFIANFAPDRYTVILNTNLDNNGCGMASIIDEDGNTLSAQTLLNDCSATFNYLDSVHISANSLSTSYFFTGWNDHDSLAERTILLTCDTSITAMFEAVEEINAADATSIKVTAHNNSIIVTGADGQTIRVLDILGRTIATTDNAPGTTTFPIRHKGVYLIQVDNQKAEKVVVR